MRGRFGSLLFETMLPEGTAIILYLKLNVAPWAEKCRVAIKVFAGGSVSNCVAMPEIGLGQLAHNGLIRIPVTVGEDGTCVLEFAIHGSFDMGDDKRQFVLGLAAAGYARRDEQLMRQEILEELSLRTVIA